MNQNLQESPPSPAFLNLGFARELSSNALNRVLYVINLTSVHHASRMAAAIHREGTEDTHSSHLLWSVGRMRSPG